MRYLKLSIQRNRRRDPHRADCCCCCCARCIVLLLFFLVARPVMHAEGLSRLAGRQQPHQPDRAVRRFAEHGLCRARQDGAGPRAGGAGRSARHVRRQGSLHAGAGLAARAAARCAKSSWTTSTRSSAMVARGASPPSVRRLGADLAGRRRADRRRLLSAARSDVDHRSAPGRLGSDQLGRAGQSLGRPSTCDCGCSTSASPRRATSRWSSLRTGRPAGAGRHADPLRSRDSQRHRRRAGRSSRPTSSSTASRAWCACRPSPPARRSSCRCRPRFRKPARTTWPSSCRTTTCRATTPRCAVVQVQQNIDIAAGRRRALERAAGRRDRFSGAGPVAVGRQRPRPFTSRC